MAKVQINGEVFEFDLTRKPMAEALAIEEGLKIPYAQYEEGLRTGTARSVAGFIWAVWHRDGRDVSLADILSGAVDVDLESLDVEAADGDADPTTPTPAASSTTAAATSASSPKSSASARGKSTA